VVVEISGLSIVDHATVGNPVIIGESISLVSSDETVFTRTVRDTCLEEG
jgi:hypothetical protein